MIKRKPYNQSNYTTTKLLNADIPNEWKLFNQRIYHNTFFLFKLYKSVIHYSTTLNLYNLNVVKTETLQPLPIAHLTNHY